MIMALTNKQESAIGNTLINDILAKCQGSKDNVVQLKIETKEYPLVPKHISLLDNHAIALKRKALWEVVQDSIKLTTNEDGYEVMNNTIAAVKAIAELNMLDGHYAPQKHEHTFIIKFIDETTPE